MVEVWKNLFARFDHFVWCENLRTMSPLKRFVISLFRLLFVMMRELMGGELNLRAMSLVYTTLLSLVPLLAVSFSVLKGFGVHNQIEPILFNFLEPLGEKGLEVGDQIIEFVENVKAGVLGSVGLAFLLYTVVSLIQKVESAFNFVWQVERLRGLSQRFSNYLSVILIGPVLVFSALGITASVMSIDMVQQLIAMEPFGRLFAIGTKLLPYVLIVAAFTFIYVFIPNTRVKIGAALVGALCGGILWQSTGWAFAAFIASSSKYAAIYSSFAILILLLIWMYLSWLILLVGAQVAYYVQHPQYLVKERVQIVLSNRLKERLGMQILYFVALHHHHNRTPWTLDGLVEKLNIPGEPVHRLLNILIKAGFLVGTNDEPPAYLPRQDIATLTLTEVLEGIRSAGESQFLKEADLLHVESVDQMFGLAKQSYQQALKDATLKDLIQ